VHRSQEIVNRLRFSQNIKHYSVRTEEVRKYFFSFSLLTFSNFLSAVIYSFLSDILSWRFISLYLHNIVYAYVLSQSSLLAAALINVHTFIQLFVM